MVAFQQAVDLGVDAVEVDVRLSKDGVLVLMHSERVDYTTDGSGLIEDMSLSEIKKLDAGYQWSADEGKTFPFRGQNISVPTLEEAFQAFPGTRFVLDVKWTETRQEGPLCDLIREYSMTDKVVLATVYGDVMRRFREVCPEIASSAAFGEVAAFVFARNTPIDAWVASRYESLQGPYDPFGHYDALFLTADYVEDAHSRNVRVEPWVNDAEQMQRYIDLGVDGLITDYPDILLELLGRE